jgi:mannan endo-1,4-beta-mannosidase
VIRAFATLLFSLSRNDSCALGSIDVLQVIWDAATFDASGPLESYWPGADAGVSWLGVNGFNWGDTLPGNTWLSPTALLLPTLKRLAALNATMPVAISSIASTSDPRGVTAKNAWIAAAFSFARARSVSGRVRMITWHNADAATDLGVFGGEAGPLNWSSPVSSVSYLTYPALRDGVAKAPFVGVNTSLSNYLTDAQFYGV